MFQAKQKDFYCYADSLSNNIRVKWDKKLSLGLSNVIYTIV